MRKHIARETIRVNDLPIATQTELLEILGIPTRLGGPFIPEDGEIALLGRGVVVYEVYAYFEDDFRGDVTPRAWQFVQLDRDDRRRFRTVLKHARRPL